MRRTSKKNNDKCNTSDRDDNTLYFTTSPFDLSKDTKGIFVHPLPMRILIANKVFINPYSKTIIMAFLDSLLRSMSVARPDLYIRVFLVILVLLVPAKKRVTSTVSFFVSLAGMSAWHVIRDRNNAGGVVGSVAGATGPTDEVFLAAQEAAQAHRDSQGRLTHTILHQFLHAVTIGTRH